ncbi:hypothetical protein [Leptospira perolatii]|uniref:hypothetical protein n=1 Tax=Leptospira perolatii TaxID=2023191 RepID=UPI000F632F7D|nr:hypothetical protein [Leptospira perolatii]
MFLLFHCKQASISEPLQFQKVPQAEFSPYQASIDGKLSENSLEYRFRLKVAENIKFRMEISTDHSGLVAYLVKKSWWMDERFPCIQKPMQGMIFCETEINPIRKGDYAIVLTKEHSPGIEPISYRVFSSIQRNGRGDPFVLLSWGEEIAE